MSNEGILPRALGRVHGERRTPYIAILATTALAMVLITTGDLADLASMTVFLLLGVFILVNVSVLVLVLVLRRDEVDHRHFRAATVIPIIGAIVSLALMVFETDGRIALRALFLLGIGAILLALTLVLPGRRPPGAGHRPDGGDRAPGRTALIAARRERPTDYLMRAVTRWCSVSPSFSAPAASRSSIAR